MRSPFALAAPAFAALLAIGSPLSPAFGADLPAAVVAAQAEIDAATLSGAIRFLSSDLLEGRGPGSRGDEVTRLYLATELARLGLEPGAADGTYDQRFAMIGLTTKAPQRWAFRGERGIEKLAWSIDYIGGAGVQSTQAGFAESEVVFVGYGIEAPEYGWDDFKGADLSGKVLLMLNNDPDWDPKLFEGNRRLYYGRWRYKYESAARHGAAGAIIVHTTPSAGYPWQVVQTSWGGEQFELPAVASEPRIQFAAWATEEASRRLVALGGKELDALVAAARRKDFRPIPLGVRAAVDLKVGVRSIETGNVLGLLRGSDPALRDEVVIYTGHHDHLGVGTPDEHGDAIYNGAVDNATGCAQLLALAKAFAALPERPRRSILFAFVAAEEQGLLGSKYLAENPPFPAGRIAANLNFDAGNVFGRTEDLTYIGFGKSSLDALVVAAAARQGRTVHGDAMPDRGFFYRSDQFNFAKIGVPALYLDGGQSFVGKDPEYGKRLQERYESTCYHQPCDAYDPSWDLSGMIEDTRIGFECGWQIAQAEAMPTWNAGDEFEAARKKAIGALKP